MIHQPYIKCGTDRGEASCHPSISLARLRNAAGVIVGNKDFGSVAFHRAPEDRPQINVHPIMTALAHDLGVKRAQKTTLPILPSLSGSAQRTQTEIYDVADAGHMVAGDRNHAFNAGVISFLRSHLPTT